MGFLGLSWYLWGIMVLVAAGVVAFIAPREQGDKNPIKYIIVRWFFALVLVLLSIAFFLLGTENMLAIRVAYVVAISSGVVYAIYFIATIRP